jgi:NAD(P)-dependent dehydrogenase (short-subunit alcohol dehydrogenase family)
MSKPFPIVTGASAGIGLELAALCAEEGFDLLVAAYRPEIHQAADRSLARIGSKKAGSGPVIMRSYDWPKNATRRRATTPRISNCEKAMSAMASSNSRSSASVMKSSR